MPKSISFVRAISQLGTILQIRLWGTLAGKDSCGQRYYRLKGKDWLGREKRAVLYAGEPEASKIPPAWRAWLQHLCDDPPVCDAKRVLPKGGSCGYVWLKSHVANLTGSDAAFVPPGYDLCRFGISDSEKHRHQARLRETWVWTPPVQ